MVSSTCIPFRPLNISALRLIRSRHEFVPRLGLLAALGAFVGVFSRQTSSFGSLIQAPSPADEVAWSRQPPAGLKPAEAPQLVATTFDDNFGLAAHGSVGGVNAIVQYYAGKRNPMGKGDAADFGGAPIRATFFDTAIYMADSTTTVLGGKRGEDGRNLMEGSHRVHLLCDEQAGGADRCRSRLA